MQLNTQTHCLAAVGRQPPQEPYVISVRTHQSFLFLPPADKPVLEEPLVICHNFQISLQQLLGSRSLYTAFCPHRQRGTSYQSSPLAKALT